MCAFYPRNGSQVGFTSEARSGRPRGQRESRRRFGHGALARQGRCRPLDDSASSGGHGGAILGERDDPIDGKRKDLARVRAPARSRGERFVGAEHRHPSPSGTAGQPAARHEVVDGLHRLGGIARAVTSLEYHPRLERKPAGPSTVVATASIEQDGRFSGAAQRFERGLGALRRIELTHRGADS